MSPRAKRRQPAAAAGQMVSRCLADAKSLLTLALGQLRARSQSFLTTSRIDEAKVRGYKCKKLLRDATILLFYSTYQMKDCHLLLLATLAVATITSAADIREVYRDALKGGPQVV